MNWIEIILLSVGLGLDAFSVAMVVGSTIFGPRQIFRLSFHFGLFQFLMPILGWRLEETFSGLFGDYGHWVAFFIMAVIGVRMVISSLGKTDEQNVVIDRTRKWSLVFLSLATSIDALGAGFGISLVSKNLLIICGIIGITAVIMTLAGMVLGRFMKRFVGKRAETIGGIILIGIAIKILFG